MGGAKESRGSGKGGGGGGREVDNNQKEVDNNQATVSQSEVGVFSVEKKIWSFFPQEHHTYASNTRHVLLVPPEPLRLSVVHTAK